MKHALIIAGIVDTVSLVGGGAGWVEIPDHVFGGFTHNADGSFAPPAVTPVTIEDRRKNLSLVRGAFCLALVGAGILPQAEAIDAAKGNWPATFGDALAGLTDVEKVGAQIEWATAQSIRRNHPLISMLAAAAGLSDGEVDVLFGA
jgi:hypothetical protein